MKLTKYPRIILFLLLTLNLSAIKAQHQLSTQDMMVRIAEIEIHPAYVNEYRKILKEEAAASIAKERGVIAIFPMLEKERPDQIRIIEIYANKEAYEAHLKTTHFLEYKTSTMKMVKSLKLVEMEALDKQMMSAIFKKLE